MTVKTYTVAKGDTLWGISRHFGIDIDDLSRVNGLRGKLAGMLSVGQVLVLPGQEEAAADTELVIRLLDLAFRPLPQARLKVEFDRESREFTTDGDGKTRIILIHDRSYGVKVHYRERDGQYTLIADHKTLPLGRKLLTMTSRKMALDGVTVPQQRSERMSTQEVRDQIKHDHAPLVIQPRADQGGASPAPKPPAPPPGPATPPPVPVPQKVPALPPVAIPPAPKPAEMHPRTEGGTPVHVAAPLFASENLKLAPANECYRTAIIAMSKKYGLIPQTLAALINTEAAKKRNAQGRATDAWDPASINASTHATGLTQFLKPAWFEVCARRGTQMNDRLRQSYPHYTGYRANSAGLQGCIETTVPDKKGKPVHHQSWQTVPDCHGVLAWRLNPECAIEGAAAYAVMNLERLKQKGIATEALTPEDKAKVAYLAHHEGAGGAMKVLKGTLDADSAENLLAHNCPQIQLKLIDDFEGESAAAYAYWLYYDLIDKKIVVADFAVQPDKLGKARSMQEIAVALGGKAWPDLPPGARERREQAAPKKKKTAPSAHPASAKPAATPAAQAPAPSIPGPNINNPSPTSGITANGSLSTIGTEGKNLPVWSDPLSNCALRTAKLSGMRAATFGMVRTYPNGQPKAHQGIDLVATPGTEIHAVAPGRIAGISTAFNDTKSFGATILLEVQVDDLPPQQRAYYRSQRSNDEVVYFFYAHLCEIKVKYGDKVATGKMLGKSGCSGNAHGMNTIPLGAHLHFEVHFRPGGLPKGLDGRIDPLPFLSNYDHLKALLE